jgi:hypothetical protein
MLSEDGTIDFVEDLAQVVEDFLAQYEMRKGPLANDLERGLVISYILGIMRCDLEALWDELGKATVFGGLHPRVVFEDCASTDEHARETRQAAIAAALRKRRWQG